MSLNQIIDQNPSGALVCDATLNLKAENLRIVDNLSFDPAGGSVFSSVYTVNYEISSVLYTISTTSGACPTGTLYMQRIGSHVSMFIPKFSFEASNGPSVNGQIAITLSTPIPTEFRPRTSAWGSFCQSYDNDVLASTPAYITYDSPTKFTIFADASGSLFTCGRTAVPSLAEVGPGEHDVYGGWLSN